MALFRRGQSWWCRFEYRGRRYREAAGTRSQTLAREIARKRRTEVEEAANGIRRHRNAAILFSVASADWLALKTPAWAPKTTSAATLDVAHLKRHFGGLLLVDIDVPAVGEYVVARRAARAAEKTIRNELGTLRGILKYYRLWSQLKDDGIALPQQRDVEYGVALTVEEEQRLLVACAASRSRSLYPAVAVSLASGLRQNELRLLRWRSVDFTNDAIRVGQSKTAHGDGRAVPLNQQRPYRASGLGAAVSRAQTVTLRLPLRACRLRGDEEVPTVFDVDPTKPIGSWKVAWTTAREVAGVTCRWHDMRGTTVTRLLERGVPFAVVATIMGWSPASAVRMVKRYGHIGESAQRQAMRLDPVVTPPAEPAATVTATARGVH